MANSEESNPLLPNQEQESGATAEKKPTADHGCKHGGSLPPAAVPIGWTADGLPVGEPMTERAQWSSGILSCLGTNDEFCSSDLEVCEFLSAKDSIFMHLVVDCVNLVLMGLDYEIGC
ncbi:PLAC8 family protein [Striga hermonthica]|uniref:PLAC8 family protein n=1 Tax=Striga hermonthica TaxID=68872 RepID=A0A9N7NUR7_STRHE|nr:PLAC8 family protein [Striga hermonthica]